MDRDSKTRVMGFLCEVRLLLTVIFICSAEVILSADKPRKVGLEIFCFKYVQVPSGMLCKEN